MFCEAFTTPTATCSITDHQFLLSPYGKHLTMKHSWHSKETVSATFVCLLHLHDESYEIIFLPFYRHHLEWNRRNILTSRALGRLITVYTNSNKNTSRCPSHNITPIHNLLIRSRNTLFSQSTRVRVSRRSTFVLNDNQEMKIRVWLVPVL